MRKFFLLICFSFVALFSINNNNNDVFAGDVPQKVVFVQIQAGGIADNSIGKAATQEFISIYNNSLIDIDISGWKITNKSDKSLVCFNCQDSTPKILSSHKYLFIASNSFVSQRQIDYPDESAFVPDVMYSPTNAQYGDIIASSDNLTIIDRNDTEIDNVSWSSSIDKNWQLQRLPSFSESDTYVDSDNMQSDFIDVNNIELSPNIIGLCPNIAGYQDVVPDGLIIDENGDCVSPPTWVCKNIPGSLVVPLGLELDSEGNCVEHDECPNIPESQTVIPYGYKKEDDGSCVLNVFPIVISELMPNFDGDDYGNEFIEIYNPNDTEVILQNYILYVGSTLVRVYEFPDGAIIQPKQYLSFSNNEIKFTLVNTSSVVEIRSLDEKYSFKSSAYDSPNDGWSWALINGEWQYTNIPTPDAENRPAEIAITNDEIGIEDLHPCAANQYRNPLTNRCKLLPEYESVPTPCRDGQYRSEETGRCRNIISDVVDLVPCAEGQERNPATNRCRTISSVLGASDLVPCKEGQERNPETNRCRNIVSMPKADYAPEKTTEVTDNKSTWLIIVGVGALVIGYGVWEWRKELSGIFKKLALLLHLTK